MFLLFVVVTNTYTFGVISFNLLKSERLEVIKNYEAQRFERVYSDDLTGFKEYRVYSSNRYTSFNKTIYIDNKDDIVKAIFSSGEATEIIYISNDNINEDGFFENSDYLNDYGKVKKLAENWYYISFLN